MTQADQFEEATDEVLVRSGHKRRTWKDWGFPNGLDYDLATSLLSALQARATGTALDLLEQEGAGSLGVTVPFLSRWIDELMTCTSLNEARLAADLVHDLNPWEAYSATKRMLSDAHGGRSTGPRSRCPKTLSAKAPAATEHLKPASGQTTAEAAGTTLLGLSPMLPPDVPAAKKGAMRRRDELVAAICKLEAQGVDIRTTHRGELHRRTLSEAAIKDGQIGSSFPTFERALKEVLQTRRTSWRSL